MKEKVEKELERLGAPVWDLVHERMKDVENGYYCTVCEFLNLCTSDLKMVYKYAEARFDAGLGDCGNLKYGHSLGDLDLSDLKPFKQMVPNVIKIINGASPGGSNGGDWSHDHTGVNGQEISPSDTL